LYTTRIQLNLFPRSYLISRYQRKCELKVKFRTNRVKQTQNQGDTFNVNNKSFRQKYVLQKFWTICNSHRLVFYVIRQTVKTIYLLNVMTTDLCITNKCIFAEVDTQSII